MNSWRHPSFIGRIAVLGWLVAGPGMALAQEDPSRSDIAAQNRLLEQQNEQQQQDQPQDQQQDGGSRGGSYGGGYGDRAIPAPQPYSGGGGRRESQSGNGGDTAAMLLQRVSALEEQLRSLQGANDELRNALTRQNQDLSKQIADLSFRVQALEGGKPANAGGTASVAPAGDKDAAAGLPVAARGKAGAQTGAPVGAQPVSLQQGYAALARRDYPAAEQAARATLSNPRSPRAYDAQFLLAQSLGGQRSYQQAALAYDDSYNRQRRGSHAADALVGLASSLAALGEKPAACATLDKLAHEFANPRADLRASAGAVAKRAACR